MSEMTGNYAGFLPLVIWGGMLVALLWGSILAIRHARNWATLMLMIGTCAMAAGLVVTIAVMTIAFRSLSGSSSGPPSALATVGIVMAIGGILIFVGALMFCAGFVGTCAKYGVTTRRAEELEQLVMQLQQRIQMEGGPGSVR